MKHVLATGAALLLAVGVAYAGEECLDVGSPVGAFYVADVTGPSAGTKLCYRCKFKDRPVVSIFAREVNDQVAGLVKQVDGVVGQNQDQKMAAFVVLLTDEPEAAEGQLKSVAKKHGIQNTPLTTFDGVAGPASYKLPKDADVTVMMWVDGQLKVNESLKLGELNDAKVSAVLGDTEKILN
ncbi:MAG: hypothetical protein ACF8TS_16315 [Maioricimonas sp. JB049]